MSQHIETNRPTHSSKLNVQLLKSVRCCHNVRVAATDWLFILDSFFRLPHSSHKNKLQQTDKDVVLLYITCVVQCLLKNKLSLLTLPSKGDEHPIHYGFLLNQDHKDNIILAAFTIHLCFVILYWNKWPGISQPWLTTSLTTETNTTENSGELPLMHVLFVS